MPIPRFSSPSLTARLTDAKTATATVIDPIAADDFAAWKKKQAKDVAAWVEANGFRAGAGQVCLIPAAGDNRKGARQKNAVAAVLFGLGGTESARDMWTWAGLPDALPTATYRLAAGPGRARATAAALGWALGTYRFDRYCGAKKTAKKDDNKKAAVLIWPAGADRAYVKRTAAAMALTRDLINTPAADMGPSALAAAARKLATAHKATCRVIAGAQLLKKNYPAVHAVGRAADDAPRLIDITWGKPHAPKVTLVGKGVTFDTGGLDIKPASAMKLMKKDMGGGAAVLGLAAMIMAAKLPVRLRVLVPAVENAVAGNAMRPMDVVDTRAGISVEIGHTDAEGRVILADALSEAAREKPDLLIDCATLTGAARVALGTELPALFCNDDKMADAILRAGSETGDPLWRLPLWPGYRDMVVGKVADLTNSAEGGYGGAITAALFLERFVADGVPWAHIDMMAWNVRARPGRPEGGEAQAIRALYAMIEKRFSA